MTGRKGRSGRRPAGPAIVPLNSLPQPPRDMSDVARAKFIELRDLIASELPGRLTAADADLLALYSQTWEMMRRALAEIGESPYREVEGRAGKRLVEHPAGRVFRDCGRQLQSLQRALGLSPAGRKQLGPTGANPKGNAFARLHAFPSDTE